MQFRRNKPQNILEQSQIIGNLPSMLPKETLLQLLPFVDNPKEELEKLEEEKQEGVESFGMYQNLARAFQTRETRLEERLSRKRRLRKDEPAAAQCMD